MFHHLANTVAILNSGGMTKRTFIKVKSSSQVVKTLLHALYTSGIIASYSKSFDNSYFTVFFAHEYSWCNLKLASSSSPKTYISYITLSKQYRACPFMLISTSKGLLTHTEALENHLGGIPLVVVSFGLIPHK